MNEEWGWKRAAEKARKRYEGGLMRSFVTSAPWLTVGVLLLMFNFISTTITRSEGVLFDLPEGAPTDAIATKLVALATPIGRRTIVFFDDARYELELESARKALTEDLTERALSLGETTILVLADRRLPGGDLIELAEIAKSSGLESVLFAEKNIGDPAP